MKQFLNIKNGKIAFQDIEGQFQKVILTALSKINIIFRTCYLYIEWIKNNWKCLINQCQNDWNCYFLLLYNNKALAELKWNMSKYIRVIDFEISVINWSEKEKLYTVPAIQ